MGQFKVLSLAVVAAAALAGASRAQTLDGPPDAPIPSPAQSQGVFGNLAGEALGIVTNAAQVDLSAQVIYDDNVARSSAAAAAARGITQSDEIFEPTVALNLARVLGRESVYLRGTVGYDFYARNSVLNRETVDLSGGVNARFLRCHEAVTANYSRFQSDLADLTRGIVKNTRQNATVEGSVDCGGEIGLAPSASISQTWNSNSNPLEQSADSNILSVNGSLAYRRPSFGSLALFGSYSAATFPNASVIEAGPVPNFGYKVYAGGVTLTRRLGARIEGTASLSYTVLQSTAAGAGNFHGVTYSGDLIYHASSRLYAEASISRSTVPSPRLGSNFAVDELYGLNLHYKMGSRIAFNLSGERFTSSNNQLVIGPIQDLRRQESYVVSGSGIYTLNRLISLSLTVSDTESSADVGNFNYSDQRVALGVTAHF